MKKIKTNSMYGEFKGLSKQDGYNFQKGIIKANIFQGLIWLGITIALSVIMIIGFIIGGII